MKKVKKVKNISNGPVLLNDLDGVAFVISVGEESKNYRKDSRFNEALRNNRIKELTVSVDDDELDEEVNELEQEKDNSPSEDSKEDVETFFFERPLSELSPKIQESLYNAGFEEHKGVQRATNSELKEIDGIGDARLEEIRDKIGSIERKEDSSSDSVDEELSKEEPEEDQIEGELS